MMTKQVRKARAAKLAADLYRSQLPEAQAIKELIGLLIDEAKDSLVDASGDDTLRLQGEAKALLRMQRSITTAPPTNKEQ
jgi:hypothetical protein